MILSISRSDDARLISFFLLLVTGKCASFDCGKYLSKTLSPDVVNSTLDLQLLSYQRFVFSFFTMSANISFIRHSSILIFPTRSTLKNSADGTVAKRSSLSANRLRLTLKKL